MYLLALLPFALSLISFFLDLLCRLLQNIWANFVNFEIAEEVDTYTFLSV